MAKLPQEDLHGAHLTQGSVIVLSFTGIAMAVCVGLGIYFKVHAKVDAGVLFVVGPALFAVGILLCLPNLKNVLRGKRRERRIRQGKEPPVQKKSYHPDHPFDD